MDLFPDSKFGQTYAAEYNPCYMDFCSNIVRQMDGMEVVRIENYPKKCLDMNPILLTMREEAKVAMAENLEVRRAALKKLIQDDHDEVQNSLLRIGMGFVPTHP